MTPMQTVIETLKNLDKKFPQPSKPSDKPTYNEGAALIIKQLLQQAEVELENEKQLVVDSCLYGKIEACNHNDALEYYAKISK